MYRALGKEESKEVTFRLLFDSKSIEKKIPKLSRRALALLKYYDANDVHFPLIFRRTEYSPRNASVKQIPEIKFLDENGHQSLEEPETRYGLRGQFDEEANWLAKQIQKTKSPAEKEVLATRLLFIQEALNQLDSDSYLVTENLFLLSHRGEFQRKFSRTPLNIVSMEEMAEYIDLTFKYNSQYLASRYISISKNMWYSYSFRIKVPHYNFVFSSKEGATLADVLNNSMMEGFSQRAGFLLTSIDEMGFQYLSGVNNVTQEGMVYHFNYFVLLITGIYDSLALQTMDKYKLTFEGSHIPSRISLNPDNGKEFLKALKSQNFPLRNHIKNNCDLIKAPYLLRELVVHREGLRAIQVEDNGWHANLVTVPQRFLECLKCLGDRKDTYVQISDFGVYNGYLLSPYIFSKKIAGLLFAFCDKYLELMDYPNFLEQQPKDTSAFSFSDTITEFEENNLGF